MASEPRQGAWHWLRGWPRAWTRAWRRLWPAPQPLPQTFPPSAERRARELIAAVDAGGIPLNPARVNDIARALGLEVSRHAAVEATIARIRAVLQR